MIKYNYSFFISVFLGCTISLLHSNNTIVPAFKKRTAILDQVLIDINNNRTRLGKQPVWLTADEVKYAINELHIIDPQASWQKIYTNVEQYAVQKTNNKEALKNKSKIVYQILDRTNEKRTAEKLPELKLTQLDKEQVFKTTLSTIDHNTSPDKISKIIEAASKYAIGLYKLTILEIVKCIELSLKKHKN